MGIDRISVIRAYVDTRAAHRELRTREAIRRRQERLWRAFAPIVARTPALFELAGQPLDRFPIVRPRDVRDGFEAWNTLGLTAGRAREAAMDAEHGGPGEAAPGVSAGFSTGTSGAPGVFLASRAERARYLGQALAKLLPWDGLIRPRRIALCLRADSALYREVTNAGPFRFRFLRLNAPCDELKRELASFAPHVFIAPSHVLAELAREGFRLDALQQLFYGAEPMGEAEQGWVAAALGRRPEPIYQATEGFLGAACRHGTLHLNEDSLVIERAPVPGVNRFCPIVTDLRRTTQAMVRVQLDDLLEPLDGPCPCGSALLAVRGVEGRMDDLWRWGEAVVTPRDVETALSQAVGPETDWRAVGAATGVHIEIDAVHATTATAAVQTMLERRGVHRPVGASPRTPLEGSKRRRVRWRGD